MNEEEFIYVMACEKMINLIFTAEQTLNFMNEYKIKPDEEVKKALLPILKELESWANH